MFLLRLLKPKFVFKSKSNTLNFSLEPKPDVLLIFLVFFEKQPKSFFRTKLGNSREVFYTETI